MVTYKSISKELRLLIAEKQSTCKTEKEMNKAVNDAREEINKKYGSDWRNLKINL
jgi:predicted outer membrane protein